MTQWRTSGWLLALIALLHFAALFAAMIFSVQRFGPTWDLTTLSALRLSMGLAILWFLWPIVILIRRSRIIWKVAFLLLIALPIMPIVRHIDMFGENVFGWPWGFSVVPWEAAAWTRAYFIGRSEAIKDIKDGHLVIEENGFGAGAGNRFRILRDRYGIRLHATAQCIVDSRILGHTQGYNSVSRPEIDRRYGWHTIEAVFEEGFELDRAERLRWEECARELGDRISSLPPNGEIKLRSVKLWGDAGRLERELDPKELENVSNITHWLEAMIAAGALDNVWSSRINISATLSSRGPPHIGWLPDDILRSVPDIRSEQYIVAAMEFQTVKGSENESIAKAGLPPD